MRGASVVALPYGGKEFIGRKGQAADGVNLVDKNDELFRSGLWVVLCALWVVGCSPRILRGTRFVGLIGSLGAARPYRVSFGFISVDQFQGDVLQAIEEPLLYPGRRILKAAAPGRWQQRKKPTGS
mgnify:CR=1 FL=1